MVLRCPPLFAAWRTACTTNRRRWTAWTIFRLERLLEWFCDALVFVCEFERQTYIRKIGKPRIRNERIYNGIREIEFKLIETRTDSVDFLYVGMLRDLKGGRTVHTTPSPAPNAFSSGRCRP